MKKFLCVITIIVQVGLIAVIAMMFYLMNTEPRTWDVVSHGWEEVARDCKFLLENNAEIVAIRDLKNKGPGFIEIRFVVSPSATIYDIRRLNGYRYGLFRPRLIDTMSINVHDEISGNALIWGASHPFAAFSIEKKQVSR